MQLPRPQQTGTYARQGRVSCKMLWSPGTREPDAGHNAGGVELQQRKLKEARRYSGPAKETPIFQGLPGLDSSTALACRGQWLRNQRYMILLTTQVLSTAPYAPRSPFITLHWDSMFVPLQATEAHSSLSGHISQSGHLHDAVWAQLLRRIRAIVTDGFNTHEPWNESPLPCLVNCSGEAGHNIGV